MLIQGVHGKMDSFILQVPNCAFSVAIFCGHTAGSCWNCDGDISFLYWEQNKLPMKLNLRRQHDWNKTKFLSLWKLLLFVLWAVIIGNFISKQFFVSFVQGIKIKASFRLDYSNYNSLFKVYGLIWCDGSSYSASSRMWYSKETE